MLRIGVASALLVAATLLGGVAYGELLRARARLRVAGGAAGAAASLSPRAVGALSTWLVRAGFSQSTAPQRFLLAVAAAVIAAALQLVLWWQLGVGPALARGALEIPGPLGMAAHALVELAPVLLFVAMATLPALGVRGARALRTESIERDLPVALELLAALGRTGLGFDAAVEHLVANQPASRPFAQELRRYQRDLLAGQAREVALRRLATRIDVSSVSMLISALIQAEQIGSSLSEVLRLQAEDLRQVRRERALARAEVLQLKLMFPLVLCFLPALLVAAAGPAFHQFTQLMERVLHGGF